MRLRRITVVLLACLAPIASHAQTSPTTNSTGHGGDPGANGGGASDTTPWTGDPRSMKGKIIDPNLTKNGTGSGQSPEVPTGVATQPGTDNTAPTP